MRPKHCPHDIPTTNRISKKNNGKNFKMLFSANSIVKRILIRITTLIERLEFTVLGINNFVTNRRYATKTYPNSL